MNQLIYSPRVGISHPRHTGERFLIPWVRYPYPTWTLMMDSYNLTWAKALSYMGRNVRKCISWEQYGKFQFLFFTIFDIFVFGFSFLDTWHISTEFIYTNMQTESKILIDQYCTSLSLKHIDEYEDFDLLFYYLTLCMLGNFFKYFFLSKDAKNHCFLPNILLIYNLNVK